MKTLDSLIHRILVNHLISWVDIKEINRMLNQDVQSEKALEELRHLIRAINLHQVVMDHTQPQHDLFIASSIRAWQLYLLNFSKTSSAPGLEGSLASCALP